jgi:hypothetical protein
MQERIQVGNGMSYGCHTKVLIARILVKAGYFVNLQDAINAFNALERQAMLDTVALLWPEAVSLVNKTYGIDAPCIFLFTDDDGTSHVARMLSQQGVRMGCVMGTFLYCLTVYDKIYAVLEREFPNIDAKAATDDLTGYGTASSPEEWHERYNMLVKYIKRFIQLGEPIGIKLHPGKGRLLIPPNAPNPPADSELHTLTTVTREAVRDTGGHIGPDAGVMHEGIL